MIEHFYRKQSDAINQRLTSDLGRHGIQLKDVRQYWEKADPKEAKIILGCIIETCEALEHVLWYGKVNRDAFLRVMAKIECSSGEHVPERSVFDTLLRDASFASQKRCLADLTQVIDVLSRLQLETGHHTPGDHPLFLKEAFVYCNYTEKLQVLYSAILRDDVSEMTKFLRSCQYVVDSKCRPNSVLLDLLEYSVLQGAERCAAYLTVEVNDTQSQKADLGSGNLLHRLVIKKGRLLRFRHRAGEVICNDIGKADTEIVKGRDAVAYVVQKLSSKERTMLQQKDAFGRLPLHYAVEYGLSELCLTIMRLIDRSDLVYSSDADGITPLHLAVISNSTLTTKTLLDPWAQSTGQILDPTFERVINSCLIEAVNLDYPEVSLMLISHGADLNYRNASGATPLFYAARNGSEQLTKALLERLTQAKLAVDSREDVRGWSPLLVACVEGHLPVVELLLKAGADPKLRDVFGWTAKEHAVFRGHMRIAQLLPPLDFRYSQIEIQALLGTHRSFSRRYSTGIPLGNVVPSQTVGISNKTRILVTLGPLNTRKKVTAVDLSPNRHKRAHGLRPELRYALQITAVAASGTSQLFDLPILRDVTNEPLHFETGDADSVRLIFNLYRIIDYADETEDGKNLVGRGIALLNSLRDTLGSKHESLYRDYTIPIMNTKSLEHMGNVTFGFIMITPFVHKSCRPSARQGFWEPEKGTQVIGHRGSGANTSAKTNLQIGENTVQSFLTAHALGASCVEFDVQLSKDFQTVIFHDFLVMATGGNVPLQTLTLDQFMHFGTLQSPRGDLSSIAEARYTGKMKEHSSKVGRPRSLSLNEYDEGRSEDTVNRMRYTEEGIHNDIKGNLRGHSIHEPGSTLEQLLTELPDRIAFNLEISESFHPHSHPNAKGPPPCSLR